MLYLRRGHNALRISSKENALFRRYASCRHKEPKELSWQWSVKRTPELMKCKNLCVSKICPKPSFFPRFKKVFVPADKKACETKKPTQSWKEYLSFLLPDTGPKPSLIKCRKLQAERRKRCENPMECTEDCLRVNCCPPPKEWYGQAEIFAVPSSLPPTISSQQDLQPCAPPPFAEPTCILPTCPLPKKSLNMDDYAYKKAFSGINLCDEIRDVPSSFLCKHACVPPLPESEKNRRLSCGFFSEFKEVDCPKAIFTKNAGFDLPPLVCIDQKKETEHRKEINVEVKKGVCGRTTFLKPYKYGDQVEKSHCGDCARQFHSTAYKVKPQTETQRKLIHSTPQALIKYKSGDEGHTQHTEAFNADMKLEEMGVPSHLQKDFYCQPSRSGVGLHYMLLKPLSGRLRDGLFAPPMPYRLSEDSYSSSYEIDPELIKLAEQTKKNMTYGIPTIKNENKESTNTLAKQLSKAAEEKFIKKAKEKGEERPITPNKNPYQKSKLSLLKKRKNVAVATRATFMTEANNVKYAKKKDGKKKNDKKNTICAGCLGIKAAESEEKNPTPKSFIDCKVRPAGRCRGPERKVYPDEGEPTNPYWKNKQKPYSLCNKQRPVIKKKERPYKMPCEENNPKREFHSSTSLIMCETNKLNKSIKNQFHSTTSLLDSGTNIPTLYDILKVKGLGKCTKKHHCHSNDWDSHTSDSYGERTYEEYDSLPDLSKYQPKDNDTTIKKMSYPVNLWGNPDTKKKSNYQQWPDNEENKSSVGVNKVGSIHQNVPLKKRTSVQNITKDCTSPPSKYNVLFNPTTINKADNSDKNITNFINNINNREKKFSEKNIGSSKTTAVFDFKPDNKEHNTSNSKELSPCPITTQNMWGNPQYSSNSQSSQSTELVPQETKNWEQQKSQILLKDNLINDSNTHLMFRSKEEPNKVLPKTENEN